MIFFFAFTEIFFLKFEATRVKKICESNFQVHTNFMIKCHKDQSIQFFSFIVFLLWQKKKNFFFVWNQSSIYTFYTHKRVKKKFSLFFRQKMRTFDPHFRHSFLHLKRIEVSLTKFFLTPLCIFSVKSSERNHIGIRRNSIWYRLLSFNSAFQMVTFVVRDFNYRHVFRIKISWDWGLPQFCRESLTIHTQ